MEKALVTTTKNTIKDGVSSYWTLPLELFVSFLGMN
jgi:hypothetical protein